MSKNHPQRTRIEGLLAQDEVVSSIQYKEFRMTLERSINRLEERARLVHRCAICSLAIFIACVALGPLVPLMGHDWMRWLWSGCGLVALSVTGVLAGIDFYKYRPVLKRRQQDLAWAAIDQLRYDVAELKRAREEKRIC